MACQEHPAHTHEHGEACGHAKIRVGGQEAFLHDGHLHVHHEGHCDELRLPVSQENPADCNEKACSYDHQQHPVIPHGDHVDHLIEGRLHHGHGGHCDDHGPVELIGAA